MMAKDLIAVFVHPMLCFCTFGVRADADLKYNRLTNPMDLLAADGEPELNPPSRHSSWTAPVCRAV